MQQQYFLLYSLQSSKRKYTVYWLKLKKFIQPDMLQLMWEKQGFVQSTVKSEV